MLLDKKIKSFGIICLISSFGLGVAETYGVSNNDTVKILSTGLAYAMVTGLGIYAFYCFLQNCDKVRRGEEHDYLAHTFGFSTIVMLCLYNYLTEGRSYYHALATSFLYTVFYSSIYMIVIEAIYKFLKKDNEE
ncbi:hypothetical protein [Halobacteriovorax sp. ZH5_bin.2]